MSARQTCAHASPCLCEVEALRAKLAAADKRAADANCIANVADRALRDADKRTEVTEKKVEAQALQIEKAEKRIETAQFIQKQADILLKQKEKVWKERVEAQALQIVKLWEAMVGLAPHPAEEDYDEPICFCRERMEDGKHWIQCEIAREALGGDLK